VSDAQWRSCHIKARVLCPAAARPVRMLTTSGSPCRTPWGGSSTQPRDPCLQRWKDAAGREGETGTRFDHRAISIALHKLKQNQVKRCAPAGRPRNCHHSSAAAPPPPPPRPRSKPCTPRRCTAAATHLQARRRRARQAGGAGRSSFALLVVAPL
jgi:hypothetical protein